MSARIAKFPIPDCSCSSSASLLLHNNLGDWNLAVTDCLLPNHSQYALYFQNYEFEREVFSKGLEMLVKRRGLHQLQLKRDDGQGWRGKGPDFGVLGTELNWQLGLKGRAELIVEFSHIKYNKVVYPHTGVTETWRGENGGRLIWRGFPEEARSCEDLERASVEALKSQI